MKFVVPSLLAALAIMMPGEALAHRRHRHIHHHHQPVTFGLHCFNGHCSFGAYAPAGRRWREPKVRVSNNCVWNPNKDKVICKY